jgi:hypothetical protein
MESLYTRHLQKHGYFFLLALKLSGIHEPVYGKIPTTQPKIFIDRMQQAVKHLQNAASETSIESQIQQSIATPFPLVLARGGMSNGPVVTKFVDLVNQGKGIAIPNVLRPNASAQKIIEKKINDAKGRKSAAVDREGWRKSNKLPKMTSVGAVGVVRAQEVEGAAKIVGPVFEKETRVRDRYKNV